MLADNGDLVFLDFGLMSRVDAEICEAFAAVWKSASVSGAPDNSSLSHFSATTRPTWLGRAVRNRHRHAIEQEDDALIQHERAVKF